MSKAKRQARRARNAQPFSMRILIAASLGTLVGLFLVYEIGKTMLSDFSSFRSCDNNNTNLAISTCGKHGLNLGDVVLVVLFVLAVLMVFSLGVAIMRMFRKDES